MFNCLSLVLIPLKASKQDLIDLKCQQKLWFNNNSRNGSILSYYWIDNNICIRLDLDSKQVSILVVLSKLSCNYHHGHQALFMQWIQPNLGQIQLYFLPILPIFAVYNLPRQTANWFCRQIGNDKRQLESLVALHYPCVFKNQPKTQLLQSKLVKDMGEHC